MIQWLILIGVSITIGFLCGCKLYGVWGGVIAAVIPCFSFLMWLLYNEYLVPYQGGGASMWPVALQVGGTTAAVLGVCAYLVTKMFRNGP